MERDEVAALAMQAGFMIYTGCGQATGKQMPVSDIDTLLEFAKLLQLQSAQYK